MALYDDALNVARHYLGPAAEKFMTRQIERVPDAETQNLGRQHLDELARWCFSSGKLIMGDSKAKDFSEKVQAL